MTDIEEKVLEIVKNRKGEVRKVGRKALLSFVNQSGYRIGDRALQEVVERLRDQGNPICSTSAGGGGYYWPLSLEDFQRFNREQMSRVKKISAKQAKMKKAAKRMFPESLPLLGE